MQARGREAAIGMTWDYFKALLKEEYYSNNGIQKLKNEFQNHTMVGAGYTAYTERFHELAELVPRLVTPKSESMEGLHL